jgi:hypothetical protein
MHRRLCEHGNSAPRVANRGRPRSTTPAVKEDILDVVNETPGISTRRVSTQVGGTHSAVWRVLRKQQLIPTICSESRVVQILNSLPLRYVFTDEAQCINRNPEFSQSASVGRRDSSITSPTAVLHQHLGRYLW